MNIKIKLIFALLLVPVLASCGYTTGSLISDQYRTIHIPQFENKVSYGTEQNRNLYLPLLEVDITNNVVDRFLFDGNLRISDKDAANLILKGALLSYNRDVLRSTDNDEVEEYRIRIIVSITLLDGDNDEVVWEEPSFSGEATYFTTGSLARSESVAISDALEDLARRIVERTIENW